MLASCARCTRFLLVLFEALVKNKHRQKAVLILYVDQRGLEPPASSVQMRRSSQLSYWPRSESITYWPDTYSTTRCKVSAHYHSYLRVNSQLLFLDYCGSWSTTSPAMLSGPFSAHITSCGSALNATRTPSMVIGYTRPSFTL